ncbi:copper resistance protein [Acidovorax sp. GW101-3H11]|uniref:TolC family protein n=1 Tax=Acidovorax sp. GW101-3H11 TaxID=1813946 RepID=UPI0007B51070|nr:TolC family protein [Acidovorax sp. GW101-3H11]KZT17052.1 copper resistance protein [Acidovorax sp. GW101-3H11]
MIRLHHRLPLLATVLVLAGCASVSPDGLRGDVAALTQGRTGSPHAALPAAEPAARAKAQQSIEGWLAHPLTQDAAVRIALLNNPGLQARLAALGVADAERVQAITLPNPHLSLGRFANSHEREIERTLAFGLLELITLPWRAERQAERLQIATLQAAQDVVLLAADTRRAWLRAVAAEQVAATHERMVEAAEAGAELARRMVQVGNWSRLRQAREQAALQEARSQHARARLAAATAREELHRRLGLWGAQTQYQLATQLPPLPARALPADGIETTALRERLDVQAARRQLDTQATRQGWSRAGAVFGDIGIAYNRNTSTERDTGHTDVKRGWELELPLPLFDWGGAARTRAQAEVEQTAAQLQDTAVRARSEVRAAWLTYRTALDLARQQHSEVVPLRQFIADETTLRYNGMLASVWDMLAEARNSTQAVANAIEAQRDFWLAETDLQLALTGTSPGALQGLTSGAAASTTPQGH